MELNQCVNMRRQVTPTDRIRHQPPRDNRKNETLHSPKGNLLLVILYFIENLFNPITPWCFIVDKSLFRNQFFPIRILFFNQLYLFLPPHMFYLILSINSQLISGKLLIINAIFTFIPVRERASILMVFMLPYPSDQIICTSCIKSRMAFICHYVCICVFHSPLIIYKNSKKKDSRLTAGMEGESFGTTRRFNMSTGR